MQTLSSKSPGIGLLANSSALGLYYGTRVYIAVRIELKVEVCERCSSITYWISFGLFIVINTTRALPLVTIETLIDLWQRYVSFITVYKLTTNHSFEREILVESPVDKSKLPIKKHSSSIFYYLLYTTASKVFLSV